MADATVGTSETQAPATGATGGEQPPMGAPSTPSSEGGAGAQEQPKPEAGQVVAPPAVSDEERIRREVQSRSDRIVDQKLREIEQQRAQQAEALRISRLSDKDYRTAVQQQQRVGEIQQVYASQAQAQLEGVLNAFRDEALAIIPDKKVRDELAKRCATEGEFAGPGEFLQAVFDAASELKEAKLRTSIQASEQTAAQKAARAETGGMPQLGTGLSLPNLKNMTAGEKIRLGLEITQRQGT